jgi:hypothetical protein
MGGATGPLTGNIKKPAVLGAILQFGNCFDLLDTAYSKLLGDLFPPYCEMCRAEGVPIPENQSARQGEAADLVLRFLDCAVINWCVETLEVRLGQHFHAVR